jgi:hypothetical protein
MQPRTEDMTPELAEKYQLHGQKMIDAGIRYRLACVVRFPIEQEALYAQGREPLSVVNALRVAAGMNPLPLTLSGVFGGKRYTYAEAPEKFIVTKAKISYHFPDKFGKAHAYDIEILKGIDDGGRVHWDMKYDGQDDGKSDYIQAAELGRECGLDCGAFWKGFTDFPHYQVAR